MREAHCSLIFGNTRAACRLYVINAEKFGELRVGGVSSAPHLKLQLTGEHSRLEPGQNSARTRL